MNLEHLNVKEIKTITISTTGKKIVQRKHLYEQNYWVVKNRVIKNVEYRKSINLHEFLLSVNDKKKIFAEKKNQVILKFWFIFIKYMNFKST